MTYQNDSYVAENWNNQFEPNDSREECDCCRNNEDSCKCDERDEEIGGYDRYDQDRDEEAE